MTALIVSPDTLRKIQITLELAAGVFWIFQAAFDFKRGNKRAWVDLVIAGFFFMASVLSIKIDRIEAQRQNANETINLALVEQMRVLSVPREIDDLKMSNELGKFSGTPVVVRWMRDPDSVHLGSTISLGLSGAGWKVESAATDSDSFKGVMVGSRSVPFSWTMERMSNEVARMKNGDGVPVGQIDEWETKKYREERLMQVQGRPMQLIAKAVADFLNTNGIQAQFNNSLLPMDVPTGVVVIVVGAKPNLAEKNALKFFISQNDNPGLLQ
jgi:hypothetical protein